MRFLTVGLFLFACSCQSSPVGQAHAKAIKGSGADPNTIEIEIDIPESPRTHDETERAFMLNLEVQHCLQAELTSGGEFSLGIQGNMDNKGAVSSVKIEHPSESLRACLIEASGTVKAGSGDAGPFKMQISKVGATPPKSKTILLQLKNVKKFQ